MAHSKSAEKRNRQTIKRTVRNRTARSELRTLLKKTLTAIESGDATKAQAAFQAATRRLDKAARNRTIHPNEASRRKSRLAKRVAALSAKKQA